MISVAVISNGCEVDWSAGQRVASSLAGSWQISYLRVSPVTEREVGFSITRRQWKFHAADV